MKKIILDALLISINENSSVNSLLQSSPVCHKIFDPDFKLKFMSHSGVAALQIENVEDFYGHTFPIDSAPKSTRDIFNEHMHLAAKGETNTIEYSFTVGGNVIWFRTTISPFFEADGNLVYITADSIDITESKKVENDLIKAKEEAEKANNAKSEFLSGMSHELRTPMNAILGFTELLIEDNEEPLSVSQRKDVGQINKAGVHLLGLINEVLDLSKVESEKLDFSLENLNIKLLIEEVLDLVQPTAAKYGITVEGPNIFLKNNFVCVDHTRLKQVMINLLSNGIKYNKKGGAVVVAFEENSHKKMLRVNFTDTGIGIPEDKLEMLFEPFKRLHEENTEIEGTGIGLTICKKLMRIMGGALGVKSTPGKGSCFFIDIPFGEAPFLKPELVIKSENTSGLNFLQNQTLLILYIDDNASNLDLVKKIISRFPSIKLLSVDNGQAGIDLACAHLPNLILLDIAMPGMDGFTTLNHLQTNSKTKEIPVIALSANAIQHDIEKALSVGFKGYITKPFKITEFFTTIEEVLS